MAASLGNIIGRMAAPASDLATHSWLQTSSGLGELIGYDFEGMGLDRLYQVSDLLWIHRAAIEAYLYQQERDLFRGEDLIRSESMTRVLLNPRPLASAKPLHSMI